MGEKIAIAKDIKASDFEWYAASSHGDDAYAITIGGCGTSLETGRIYSFKADVANTGACTLNINAIGAVAIKKGTADTETGDIEAGQVVIVIFDGTYFQLIQGSLTQIAQTINGVKTFGAIPVGPASNPTTDNQLSRKAYTDYEDSYAAGVIADLDVTNTANNDIQVTVGFQPVFIKLHFFIQGHDTSTHWAVYWGAKGFAVWNGTTLIFTNYVWKDESQSGLSGGDNGGPSAIGSIFTNIPNLVANPTVGSGGGGAVQMTITIVATDATSFTIRRASVSDGNHARAKIAYEVWR